MRNLTAEKWRPGHADRVTMRIASMVLVVALGGPDASAAGKSDRLPEGYMQLLPRGRIAAVDQPRFVPAAEAGIPADAWVLGVALGGEARAYSLNLLNAHEVVNDRLAGQPVAAVW